MTDITKIQVEFDPQTLRLTLYPPITGMCSMWGRPKPKPGESLTQRIFDFKSIPISPADVTRGSVILYLYDLPQDPSKGLVPGTYILSAMINGCTGEKEITLDDSQVELIEQKWKEASEASSTQPAAIPLPVEQGEYEPIAEFKVTADERGISWDLPENVRHVNVMIHRTGTLEPLYKQMDPVNQTAVDLTNYIMRSAHKDPAIPEGIAHTLSVYGFSQEKAAKVAQGSVGFHARDEKIVLGLPHFPQHQTLAPAPAPQEPEAIESAPTEAAEAVSTPEPAPLPQEPPAPEPAPAAEPEAVPVGTIKVNLPQPVEEIVIAAPAPSVPQSQELAPEIDPAAEQAAAASETPLPEPEPEPLPRVEIVPTSGLVLALKCGGYACQYMMGTFEGEEVKPLTDEPRTFTGIYLNLRETIKQPDPAATYMLVAWATDKDRKGPEETFEFHVEKGNVVKGKALVRPPQEERPEQPVPPSRPKPQPAAPVPSPEPQPPREERAGKQNIRKEEEQHGRQERAETEGGAMKKDQTDEGQPARPVENKPPQPQPAAGATARTDATDSKQSSVLPLILGTLGCGLVIGLIIIGVCWGTARSKSAAVPPTAPLTNDTANAVAPLEEKLQQQSSQISALVAKIEQLQAENAAAKAAAPQGPSVLMTQTNTVVTTGSNSVVVPRAGSGKGINVAVAGNISENAIVAVGGGDITVNSPNGWPRNWKPTRTIVLGRDVTEFGVMKITIRPREVIKVVLAPGWNSAIADQDWEHLDMKCGNEFEQFEGSIGGPDDSPNECTQFRIKLKAHISEPYVVDLMNRPARERP